MPLLLALQIAAYSVVSSWLLNYGNKVCYECLFPWIYRIFMICIVQREIESFPHSRSPVEVDDVWDLLRQHVGYWIYPPWECLAKAELEAKLSQGG